MAGSGGSFDDDREFGDEIDFGQEDDLNGYSSLSPRSSHGNDADFSQDERRDSFFMTESNQDLQDEGGVLGEAEEEDDDKLGPLSSRMRIMGNGFERPIHRQSLQEFEDIERVLRQQSQDSADGDDVLDDRLSAGDGDAHGRRRKDDHGKDTMEGGQYENGNLEDYGHDNLSNGHPNGFSDDRHSLRVDSDGQGDDMLRYMQATPRNMNDSGSPKSNRLSLLLDDAPDNESLDGHHLGDHDPVFLGSSSQQDFYSLSQEQLPEDPSYLEESDIGSNRDGSGAFLQEGNDTLKHRDSLSTIIQNAAANMETFCTGSSPDGRENRSGENVGHFKPITTSNYQPNRPQTAAQLRNRSLSEEKSQSGQTSDHSYRSSGRRDSVKSARTQSSRASTPKSVLSSQSRRGSRASIRSQDHQSDRSYRGSAGQVSPRSSTPGRDSTMVQQDLDLTPSPVKHNVIPRLQLGNMSGQSEAMSDLSDISHLNRSTRSRLVSDEFVDQLQREYDDLLQKYAQAENTIDSLRLGAKVNLHYDRQGNDQPGRGAMTPGKHGQMINLGHGQRGVVTSSHMGLPHSQGGSRTTAVNTAANASPASSNSGQREGQMPPPDPSEGKLLAIQFHVAGQKDQMEAFEILLQENHLDLPDQQRGLDRLKSGQSKLEIDYMQAKEEHSMKARLGSGQAGQQTAFDPERSVEGQIFQLGMKLEDVQEAVQENLRKKPAEPSVVPALPREATPPFNHPATTATHIHGPGESGLSPDEEFAQLLHRYDALKKLPPHPERDREIQDLVKSLQNMPDFALGGSDHPDCISEGRDDVFHGNEAEIEEEIKLVDDHDGDIDGSSTHSSPFRETMSPDVFRPKGTMSNDLPKWQPPEDGSMSSLGSPDNDVPSSSHLGHKKSLSGKTQPRPNSGHRLHPSRADGDARRTRNSKNALSRQPEHEADSGFVGSEGSRQSLQTRGSDTRPKNNLQRLSPHSEVPKVIPPRESRIPTKQKTPLPRRNETVPLRQQAVPEEEGSIVSGGNKRVRERQPQASQFEQKIKDIRTPQRQRRSIPSPVETRDRSRRSPSPPSPPSRHSPREPSLPLSSQYLSRSSKGPRVGQAALPKRITNQRMDSPRTRLDSPRTRLDSSRKSSPQQHLRQRQQQQPEFDRRSDVTRSSVRSEMLQGLQDEVHSLKARLAEARRNPHPQPILEETRSRGMHRHEDDGDVSSRSSKSEMLEMLQEEIADLREQMDERDQNASRNQAPPTTSTPLRDTIRKVLTEKYIPQRDASFGASPIRASPQKYSSRPKRDYWSTIQSPPRPARGTRDYSWPRGADESNVSPPRGAQHPQSFQTDSPAYHSRTVSCPMCGGSGTHTHGDYHYAPPPVPPPVPPPAPQNAYTSAYGSPAYTQGYPQAHSTPYVPQNNQTFASPGVATLLRSDLTMSPAQPQPYAFHQTGSSMAPQNVSAAPQVVQQQPPTVLHTAGGVPQMSGMAPNVAPTAPVVQPVSNPAQQGTPSNVHPDARPVYLVASKHRGRYYMRDNVVSASETEEEFYYRRTPRSARSQASHTPRSHKHQKVTGVPMDLQISLDDAVHAAEKLKRTTSHMISSVQQDVRLAESFGT